jgi:ParB family chromosome partitioning protein
MSQQVIQHIPLDQIIGREQVRKRFDDELLTGLSQSMRETGLHEPIHLLPLGGDKYTLLTGGRRVRAARKAGWTTIAAIVEEATLTDGDVLVRQIVENVQRENLTPIERARGIDALMKAMGLNASQAASKLGLTCGTVSKLLALLSLPEELQLRIDAGELPATTAYQLTKLHDPDAQKELAGQAAKGELTRNDASSAVKATRQRRRTPRKARPMRVTAKLDNREAVSVVGLSLNLDSFLSILERLLAHAQQARSDGLTLEALLKRLASARSAAPPQSHAA